MIRNTSSGLQSSFIRKAGLWLTGLCAIHCLLVPVFVIALPVVGHYITFSVWVELAVYASVLFIGGGLMLADYKHHKIKMPLILFLVGFITIAGSHFCSILLVSNSLICFGGICLAVGQIANIRLHKKTCKHNH